MRTAKILLLVGTIVFSSDLGPLHQIQYMRVIGVLATLLFGVTAWLMFSQRGAHRLLGRFTLSTGLLFVAVGVITVGLLATGNTVFYDTYSIFLLLPVYLNTILAFVFLRERK
ncbi:MAG: hypothetical protein HY328_04195 [Chloroflexi bacterium]|nr:hypothetical protein [Chloroflexota bacterium]